MVQFTIDGKDYAAFEKWPEMPLSKAVELCTLCNTQMPKSLKLLYEAYSKSKGAEDGELKDTLETFTKETVDEDFIKNFPVFYGKVLKCLSDVPQEVVDGILSGYREAFYQKHLFKFVFGVLHFPFDFEAKGMMYFIHKGISYHLPESKTVLGEIRPMANRPVIEFAEAADLELFSKQLEGGRFERAANIISILCRPLVQKSAEELLADKKTKTKKKLNIRLQRNALTASDRPAVDQYWKLEPYNEATCLNRAAELADLKMDIVWEVFFCSAIQLGLLKQNMTLSLLRAARRAPKQEPVRV